MEEKTSPPLWWPWTQSSCSSCRDLMSMEAQPRPSLPPRSFVGGSLNACAALHAAANQIQRVHRLQSWDYFENFDITRSCAALRAADLGFSGQDAFAQWHSFDPKNVTWQTRGPTEWESAHFSLPTRGHNWPFRCSDWRGGGGSLPLLNHQ